MHDKPQGAALLAVARQALLDEIAPTLQGRPRYVALMVANAIGIASREIDNAEASERAWDAALAGVERSDDADGGDPVRRLAVSIRAGTHDADPALYGALRQTAELGAGIWKPAKTSDKA